MNCASPSIFNTTHFKFLRKFLAEKKVKPFADIKGKSCFKYTFSFNGFSRTARLFFNYSLKEFFAGKVISGIEILNNDYGTVDSGVDIISFTNKGWLNLVDNCDRIVVQMPLAVLIKNAANGHKTTFFNLKNIAIEKSYITTPDTTGLSNNNGLIFMFYFN